MCQISGHAALREAGASFDDPDIHSLAETSAEVATNWDAWGYTDDADADDALLAQSEATDNMDAGNW